MVVSKLFCKSSQQLRDLWHVIVSALLEDSLQVIVSWISYNFLFSAHSHEDVMLTIAVDALWILRGDDYCFIRGGRYMVLHVHTEIIHLIEEHWPLSHLIF